MEGSETGLKKDINTAETLKKSVSRILREGISQAEMLAFLFGAARESEKLARIVSQAFV